ncbi:MAG: glycoside hydrolase family 16 protein [Candidatus Acidiferrales bacterium]
MRIANQRISRGAWNLRLSPLHRVAAITFMFFVAVRPAGAQTKWSLVWSDEFNGPAGSAPSSDIWTFKDKGKNYNDELEVYCAPSDDVAPCSAAAPNIFEDGGGNLVIRAMRTADGTWTSGRMITSHTEMPQYGRIEARIKLTPGDGLWPAFWMLGSDLLSGTAWPACGEVDIMEWVPQFTPTTTSGTEHGPGYDGCCGAKNAKFTFPGGGRIDDGNYHIYGVIWSENKLQLYRDDPAQIFFTLTSADIPADKQWVFNQPFFLILNLAVGGDWPAPGPDNSTPTPADMLVDYVRVYRADAAITAPSPPPAPTDKP